MFCCFVYYVIAVIVKDNRNFFANAIVNNKKSIIFALLKVKQYKTFKKWT